MPARRTLIGTKVQTKMVPALRRAAKHSGQTLSAFCAEALELRARAFTDWEKQEKQERWAKKWRDAQQHAWDALRREFPFVVANQPDSERDPTKPLADWPKPGDLLFVSQSFPGKDAE